MNKKEQIKSLEDKLLQADTKIKELENSSLEKDNEKELDIQVKEYEELLVKANDKISILEEGILGGSTPNDIEVSEEIKAKRIEQLKERLKEIKNG